MPKKKMESTILPNRSIFSIFTAFMLWLAAPEAAQSRTPNILVVSVSNSDGLVDSEDRIRLTDEIRKTLARSKRNCRVVNERRAAYILEKFGYGEKKCRSECAAKIGELRNIDFVLWAHVERTDFGFFGEVAVFTTVNGSLVASRKRERYEWDDLSSALLASLPSLIDFLEHMFKKGFDEPDALESGDGVPINDSDKALEEKKEALNPWDRARVEPPVFPKGASELYGARVSAGFSFLLPRASGLENAFTPLYHLSIDFSYQLFPLFQIALVADLAQMRGEVSKSQELKPDSCGESPCETQIGSDFNSFWLVGVRPTVRMNLEIHLFETFVGIGMGYLHTSTSGKWVKTATSSEDNAASANQSAIYRFDQSTSSFYTVLEWAGTFRIFEKQLGIGVLIQCTLPVTFSGGSSPDVRVEANSSPALDDEPILFEPNPEDYRNTLVRHLNSFNMLTIALTVNYVF